MESKKVFRRGKSYIDTFNESEITRVINDSVSTESAVIHTTNGIHYENVCSMYVYKYWSLRAAQFSLSLFLSNGQRHNIE